MNCDVEGSSGSMTWGCTPATPGTEEIFLIVAAGRRPPAVKPAPIPIPRPATEIWPRTKRSPPSMKRTMRSLMAPSATTPATPIGSHYPIHRLASRRASQSLRGRRSARTTRSIDSPRGARRRASAAAARLALPFQARLDGPARPSPHPDVRARDREQEQERRPRAPRHAEEGAAREHAQHRVEHAEGAPRLEEELEECGLVVLVDEPEERTEPAPDAAPVGREAPGLEAAVGRPPVDPACRQLARL